MIDTAHNMTDERLAQMEKHITSIYTRAQEDIQKKANAYFSAFEKADAEKRRLLEQGKITEDEYVQWRRSKLMYSQRFTRLKDECAQQILHANETALAYVNGNLPEVYAMNYNALENSVDGVGGYSFELVDADTVRNLAAEDASFLPYREIDPAKDIPWNTKHMNAEVLQGILQGESMGDIAGRLAKVVGMDETAAIRNARTMVTSAECKGRQDSYIRAQNDGIVMQRRWIATKDARTRHWHAELDGALAEVDEPFENAIGKIMYPGDPSADGANVYNCRCTIAAKVLGFKKVSGNTSANPLTQSRGSGIIKLPNIQIGRSVGAKAENYDVLNPKTGEYFRFSEDTKIQNAEVFAGYGTNKPLKTEVTEGLSDEFGGDPEKWQHVKGNGVLDFYGEDVRAEVHWFQEDTVGKVKFKVKEWLE